MNWNDRKLVNGLSDIVAAYPQQAKIIYDGNCEHEDGTFEGCVGIADTKNFSTKAFHDAGDNSLYLAVYKKHISVKFKLGI